MIFESLNLSPNLQEATIELYPDAWTRFTSALEERGFRRVDHPVGRWEGELIVRYSDPGSGVEQERTYQLAIVLDKGFPFKKPEVIPISELPEGARHRAPVGSTGALCLYSDRAKGWLPEFTAADLLERTTEWLIHHLLDDWGLEDRPPDLHLYYNRINSRHLAVTGDDWNPPAGASGRFAIRQGVRTLLMSSPTEKDLSPVASPPEELFRSLGMQGSGLSVGTWFRLRAEPTPAEALGDVLRDIDEKSGSALGFACSKLRSLAGSKPRREFRTFLALGYPSASGREEWLFLDVILPAKRRRSDRWENHLQTIRVRALETAPAKPYDLVRRTAHSEALLSGKHALIFGLGAIGSSVALLLAKAGIGNITCVDAQQLRPGNCIRHMAGLRLCGLDKGSAVAAVVGQHAPYCNVKACPETWHPDELADLIAGADVVVDATANHPFGLFLNELCVQGKVAMVGVATYRRASVGRVRVVRPGQSGCMVCYLGHSDDPEYPLIPPGEEGEFVEAGCGDPTVEASAIDVEFVSNVAVQAIRKMLTGSLPKGSDECLVVITPLDEAVHPLNSEGIYWFRRDRIEGCGSCG